MKIDAETLKKQVILHLPYILFLLVFAKLGEAVRLAPGADASQKLLGLSEGFALAFQSMWPGAAMDWLIGLCGAAIMRLAVYLRGKDAKKYRKNVEYGSARWGNKADIAPFMDPKPENNIILTQSEGLMLNGRPKNPANARNKNVLVVGGSGSGKTRFFIKPNLMQMHSSYVVTDPNAERCCSEAHQSWTRTESLCVMKKERLSMSPIKYGYSIRSIFRKVCTLTHSPTFIPRKIF